MPPPVSAPPDLIREHPPKVEESSVASPVSRTSAHTDNQEFTLRPAAARPGGPGGLERTAAKHVLCIIGTRPEVIKMAPVIHALRTLPDLKVTVLSSGQHRELLRSLIDWYELTIDDDLEVMTANQTLAELTARLMRGFEQRLAHYKPDLVLAQGDTTTVFCAALSCFYANIPFGHVEAGLRTFDLRNPFPEEFNRVAVGKLATMHFCPTPLSRQHVVAEGVAPEAAFLTGNTSIDALYFTRDKLRTHPIFESNHDILLTAHRRENFGEPLEEICRAVLDLCREFPWARVLYPVHPNPKVKATAEKFLSGHPQITLGEPLDHPALVAAMLRARLILTDSGGIQEEAPSLGKPVLVLRAVSERPEAIELGLAKLVGSDRRKILAESREVLLNPDSWRKVEPGFSPYGDGQAAARIRDAVQQFVFASVAQGRAA